MSERPAGDKGLFLKHFAAGKQAYEAGRLDEAESELEEACLLRPRDQKILNLLGLLYFKQEKYDKAEEVYRKLAAGSPEAHTLFYNLGLVYLKLSRLEDAEVAFAKALELCRDNPKINFYLGSIYEKQRRFQDAIFQYRQAGASIMARQLEDRLEPARPRVEHTAKLPPVVVAEGAASSIDTQPFLPAKPIARVSDSLFSDASPSRRPKLDSPTARTLPPAPMPLPAPSPALEQRAPRGGSGVEQTPALGAHHARRSSDIVSFLANMPPPRERTGGSNTPTPRPGSYPSPDAENTAQTVAVEPFRLLQRNLMECTFAGKLFVKQGTIYSYTGNLTFWAKDKPRPGTPALVIVTGGGKVLLTDRDREIKVSHVEGPVALRPFALLACEASLTPRYFTIGDDGTAPEFLSLEGEGLIALSVASRLITLNVTPDQPVAVAMTSVVMWAGELQAHMVLDDALQEGLAPSDTASVPLIRLEGNGRVLMEQVI